MAHRDNAPISQSESEPKKKSPTKKPYEAPAWEVEDVFEKTALSCVKDPLRQCDDGPLQS